MKTLVRLLAGLVILIAILAGVGMLLPREVTVERWTQINAPAEEIYPLVANLAANQEWSPWAGLDPDATFTYGDIPEGVGATMTWASESPDVGSGSMEITEATENEALTVALNFGDMGRGTAYWEFEEAAGTTTATWRMVADMGAGPIGRWFGLKMDDWVGADYERGLANLKRVAEGG
ncbi:MAG: SRPBCC family protein [Pseudomonadota bacterium]